jgi:hypothetical protein
VNLPSDARKKKTHRKGNSMMLLLKKSSSGNGPLAGHRSTPATTSDEHASNRHLGYTNKSPIRFPTKLVANSTSPTQTKNDSDNKREKCLSDLIANYSKMNAQNNLLVSSVLQASSKDHHRRTSVKSERQVSGSYAAKTPHKYFIHYPIVSGNVTDPFTDKSQHRPKNNAPATETTVKLNTYRLS